MQHSLNRSTSRFHRTFALLLGCLQGSLFLAAADAWPEFRGPGKQGHADAAQVPVAWNDDAAIAWKVPTPHSGWSSPVVDGGQIILSGAKEEEDQISLHVSSHDLRDGSLQWQTELFRPNAALVKKRHSKNSHASPTPILADGRIYAHFGHFGTAALDLKTGKVIWSRVISYSPVHGNGGSPALVDGLLVFSVDGEEDPAVYALNAEDGEIVWRTPRIASAKKKFSFATPLVVEVKGQKQIISPGSGMVGAYAPNDGRLIWQVRYGEGYSVIPRPILHQDILFLGTGYDRPSVYAIRLSDQSGDLTDTHLVWESNRSAPNTPSLIVVDGALYFISDGGILTCADPGTGEVFWSERLRGNYSASPVAVGNHLYFVSESGMVYVVEANKKELTVLAQNDLEERSLASPAVLDGALIFRTQEHLMKVIGNP